MPPMNVTQRAAPQAVEKQRRCANFSEERSKCECWPSDLDPNVSGEKTTPIAKNATAVRNRVNHAIFTG